LADLPDGSATPTFSPHPTSAPSIDPYLHTYILPTYNKLLQACQTRRAQRRSVSVSRCRNKYRQADFPALLSVYDKDGLLPFAKGLKELGFRLLGSGGTAKMIRESGIDIE
jgi:hypothetical protein